VRHLAQARTLRAAALAAAVTAVACLPRLWLWTRRAYPLWYLEAVLFLGTIVLWAFVFAWHTRYSGRPVFTLRPGFIPFASATLAGVVCAVALRFFLDPAFQKQTPADYPNNSQQWLAMTLFHLAFNQLVLLFAPFDWLLRLLQNVRQATWLTILLGVFVVAVKASQSPVPCPLPLLLALIIVRGVSGWLGVYFYLRGGVILVWWLGFVIELRHLLDLTDFPVPS
jgi:hypothetical protein